MSPLIRWRRLLPVLVVLISASCSATQNPTQNPPCKLSDLVVPDTISPSPQEIVDGEAVVFSWDFPPSCDPSEFILEIDTREYFSYPDVRYELPGELRSWIAPDHFDEGKEFFWRIRAGGSGNDLGDWVDPIKFYTGPLCYTPFLEEILSFHPNGATLWEEPIKFVWTRNGIDCLEPGYYIEIYPEDEDIGRFPESDLLVAEYLIHDPDNEFWASPGLACGEYKWRITPLGIDAMDDPGGGYFVVPEEFATFDMRPSSCDPPVSKSPATIESIIDTPCRGGPGEDFPIQSYLLEGDSAPLVGRDIEDIWWIIENPINEESRCWIIQTAARVIGLTSELPILSSPQLPAVSRDGSGNGSGTNPTACSGYLSAGDCKAAGGTYNLNSVPPCKCP